MHIPLVRVPATLLARATIWSLGMYAVGQGFGMLIGHPDRWSGPSYTVVRSIPGGLYTWGAVVLLLGTVILIGSASTSWTTKAIGLLGMCSWSCAFSVGAFAATATVPTAGTTGGPTYLLIGVISAVLIGIDESNWRRGVHRPEPRDESTNREEIGP